MSKISLEECVTGQFVRELKNRFLCEVVINGKVEVCYIYFGNTYQKRERAVILLY